MNDVCHEEQAGFRPQRGTIDQIVTLYAVISKYLSKPGDRFYCLFVDFSKAFDHVPHLLLFHRLVNYGMHGIFIIVLQSMYS